MMTGTLADGAMNGSKRRKNAMRISPMRIVSAASAAPSLQIRRVSMRISQAHILLQRRMQHLRHIPAKPVGSRSIAKRIWTRISSTTNSTGPARSAVSTSEMIMMPGTNMRGLIPDNIMSQRLLKTPAVIGHSNGLLMCLRSLNTVINVTTAGLSFRAITTIITFRCI